MKIKVLFVALLISTFWACDSGSAEKSEIIKKEKPQWVEIDGNTGGYQLQIFVPIPKIAKGETKVEYLENTGELTVIAGDYFDYSMYEDESQMEKALIEIKNHPFYKVEIVEQTDSTLLYRYFNESINKESWQFYTERSLGQPLLIVKSNKDKLFSEFYARLMLESSLKITTLK
jgi:hypothetical protein